MLWRSKLIGYQIKGMISKCVRIHRMAAMNLIPLLSHSATEFLLSFDPKIGSLTHAEFNSIFCRIS